MGKSILAGLDPFGDVYAAEQQKKAQDEALAAQQQASGDAQAYFGQATSDSIAGVEGASDLARYYLGMGAQEAASANAQGYSAGLRTYSDALGASLGELSGGYDQSRSDIGAGYDQGRGDIMSGFGQGRSDLGAGYQQARGAAGQMAGMQSIGATDAYGGSMLNRPGGLYGGFEQDPGYQFRQQQGEQAINRQAAAQGGRGGGATMKALADYNQGLASQEFGNYAARQQSAAGLESGYLQSQAGRADQAGLAAQGYRAAGLGQLGQYGMQYGQGMSGMGVGQGQALSGMSTQQGQQLGAMAYGYGSQRSGMQNQYGQDAAGLSQQHYGDKASQAMSYANQQGQIGINAANNEANLRIGLGTNNQQNANSMMGAYANYANYGGMEDQAQANSNKEFAAMMMSMFSDRRLKSDIGRIRGSRYERLGLNGYGWTWNDHANRLGYFGKAEGVIAQEVAEKYPHAVGTDVGSGWMYVDYDELEQMLAKAA
jgi:hypothetical protein